MSRSKQLELLPFDQSSEKSIELLGDEDLTIKVSPPPVHQPQVDWKTIALWLMAGALVWFFLFSKQVDEGDQPTPIDERGFNVLVLKPTDTSGLTQGQIDFITSAQIPDWVESNGGKFRSYSDSEDLSEVEKVWREMKAQAFDDYRLIVTNKNKLHLHPLPEGIEAGLRIIEGHK